MKRGFTYLFITLSLLTTFLSACSSDSEPDDFNSSKNNPDLIGKWELKQSSTKTKTYHFLSKGKGYADSSFDSSKYGNGLYRCHFEWYNDEETIYLRFEDDPEIATIKYSVSGNNLTLNQLTYSKISNAGSVDFDYTKKPYDSYIYNGSYYFPLIKVEAKCSHGTGTSANEKYLMFYGINNQITPVGLYFYYATPYYEGIDANWPNGTYKTSSKTGYWTYRIIGRAGRSVFSGNEGTLKIKTAGNLWIFDYEGDDYISLHFEGKL